MYRLVLLALVAAAAADQCPHVDTVENFDFERFFTGTWYELARYTNSPFDKGQCGYSNYTLQQDKTFKTNDCQIINGKTVCLGGSGWLSPEANNHGVITLKYPATPYAPNSFVLSTLNIVATDYDNYAIYHFCKHDDKRNVHLDLAWVMGRNKGMTKEGNEEANEILKKSKFIQLDKLETLDFSEEACKITAY